MKTLLFLSLLLVLACLTARGLDLTVETDAAGAEFQVTAYALYEWTDAATAVKLATAETPKFTLRNVTAGVHKYEVRLVNLWGESAAWASGETPPLPPNQPQGNPLRFKLVTIEQSNNLTDWHAFAAVAIPDEPGPVFYRIAFNP